MSRIKVITLSPPNGEKQRTHERYFASDNEANEYLKQNVAGYSRLNAKLWHKEQGGDHFIAVIRLPEAN